MEVSSECEPGTNGAHIDGYKDSEMEYCPPVGDLDFKQFCTERLKHKDTP